MRSEWNDSEPIGAEIAWLETVVGTARRHAEILDDATIRFVDSLHQRVADHGERTLMSRKQLGWVKSIEQQLLSAGARFDPDAEDGHGA